MINYSDIINHYPDFPKPGIDFIDILPFLSNKEAFKQLIADIDAHTHCPNVATVEARGFLFAAPLLTQSKLVEHIIPIRKKGKLPYAEGDLYTGEWLLNNCDAFEDDRNDNLDDTVRYILSHPFWRLSVQLHKIAGLR